MKSLRFMLSAAVLMSLSFIAFAQSDAQKPDEKKLDAQKSFDKLKTVAGSWEGHVTTFPPDPDSKSNLIQVTLRVTSMGNAMVHEMKGDGPDDPITMLYLDGDRLLLTHYCDAGKRPRMVGRKSPDGKTVEFDFLDVAGSTQNGHMQHAVFTMIDANHHTEDWTYLMPGDKLVRGHLELQRTK